MGGMNIADRYTKGTSWGTWRDTHFKIIGKGVHGLQAAFLIDWYVVSKKLLNEKIYYPPLPVYSDDNIMQICTSGPVGQWRTLLQAAIFTVANAKKYVFIQTPYFLPTEGLNQALQEYFSHLLGKRGLVDKCVDLEIMLEAAEVHIGGTDAGQFVVCHHQFRVKESRFIEIDLDARLYHFINERVSRHVRRTCVRTLGKHQPHVDAS